MLDIATISNFGQNAISFISAQSQNAFQVSSEYMGRAVVWISEKAPHLAQNTLAASKKVLELATPYFASFVSFAKNAGSSALSFALKNKVTVIAVGTGAMAFVGAKFVYDRLSHSVSKPATPKTPQETGALLLLDAASAGKGPAILLAGGAHAASDPANAAAAVDGEGKTDA